MKSEEIIEKMFEAWKEWEVDDIVKRYHPREQKRIFLSSEILGLTTYDEMLDIAFGKMVVESMIQIQNRTTFEYIEDKENYRNFILSCNLMNGWLDWGSSIRGAWFDEYNGKIAPDFALSNIDHDKDHISITKGFMEWFINFLEE